MARSTMTLDELVRQFSTAYGPDLQCMVLYGSAASGEQLSAKSDHNVLVIVHRISRSRLQQLSTTTRAWSEAGNPPPLTLTTTEWRRSADIFPMEYADILERHRVLSGSAPFEGIRVNTTDLRLQVEHEAMGILLKLRAGMMAAGGDAKLQGALLTDSLSALMVVFRASLRLSGDVPEREYAAVARKIAERVGFDHTPFLQVIELARNSKSGALSDTAGTLDAYVEGMEQLVSYIDRFEVPLLAEQ
jgi:hypothetical protein